MSSATATLFPGVGPTIKKQYTNALKTGSLIYTESEIHEVDELGIPFEIRFAPALAKKPSAEVAPSPASAAKKPDPFAPPYNEDLYVAEDVFKEADDDEGEAFVVLLNKFCIVPNHFLLVTKEFVPQSTPLTPGELLAAYSILKQLGTRAKHLGFFNCGPDSGASQPHKHLQFIPLNNGVAPFDHFIAEHKPEKANAPFQLPLPYANLTVPLNPPANLSQSALADYLTGNFFAILDLLFDHIRRLALTNETWSNVKLSNLSYNFIMTTEYIHLVPRTAESYTLKNGEEASMNSLAYAGFVLTKTESALKGIQEVGVLEVLGKLGFPPVAPGEAPEEEVVEAEDGADVVEV